MSSVASNPQISCISVESTSDDAVRVTHHHLYGMRAISRGTSILGRFSFKNYIEYRCRAQLPPIIDQSEIDFDPETQVY